MEDIFIIDIAEYGYLGEEGGREREGEWTGERKGSIIVEGEKESCEEREDGECREREGGIMVKEEREREL